MPSLRRQTLRNRLIRRALARVERNATAGSPHAGRRHTGRPSRRPPRRLLEAMGPNGGWPRRASLPGMRSFTTSRELRVRTDGHSPVQTRLRHHRLYRENPPQALLLPLAPTVDCRKSPLAPGGERARVMGARLQATDCAEHGEPQHPARRDQEPAFAPFATPSTGEMAGIRAPDRSRRLADQTWRRDRPREITPA
jgi:hypothetical protein